MIHIRSLRGEGLLLEDGTSVDPFVTFKCGSFEAKSETVKKSNGKAQFQQLSEFKFPWVGSGPIPEFELFTYDHDTLSANDFIGYARVRVNENMVSGQECHVSLGPRNDKDRDAFSGKSLGALIFTLEYVPDPNAPPHQPSHMTPSPMPPRSLGTPQQQQQPSSATEPIVVHVQSLRATNLYLDDGSSVDPYVIMKTTAGQTRTETIKGVKDGSASWKDISNMSFCVYPNVTPSISFLVYDSDTISADDFIGMARVQVTKDVVNSGEHMFSLVSADPKQKLPPYLGELHLSFSCAAADLNTVMSPKQQQHSASGAATTVEEPRVGALEISVTGLSARGLLLEDGTTVDPYVTMECRSGSKVVKAKSEVVRESTGTATWSKLAPFTVPWDGTTELPTMNFTVYDWDRLSCDDVIGQAQLHLALPMFSAKEVVVHLSSTSKGLSTKSLGCLVLQLAYNGIAPKERSNEIIKGNAVVKVHSLMAEGLALDSSNPKAFCELSYNRKGEHVAVSTEATLGSNVSWKQLSRFSLEYDPEHQPMLSFNVFGYHTVRSNDFLGHISFTLKPEMINTGTIVMTLGARTDHDDQDKLLLSRRPVPAKLCMHFSCDDVVTYPPAAARSKYTHEQQQQQMILKPSMEESVSRATISAPTPPPQRPPIDLTTGKFFLELDIIEAFNLLDVPSVDPFIVIYVCGPRIGTRSVSQTQTAMNTRNPKFHHITLIPMDKDVTCIKVCVWNGQNANDFLGQGYLTLDDLSGSSTTLTLTTRDEPPRTAQDDVARMKALGATSLGSVALSWTWHSQLDSETAEEHRVDISIRELHTCVRQPTYTVKTSFGDNVETATVTNEGHFTFTVPAHTPLPATLAIQVSHRGELVGTACAYFTHLSDISRQVLTLRPGESPVAFRAAQSGPLGNVSVSTTFTATRAPQNTRSSSLRNQLAPSTALDEFFTIRLTIIQAKDFSRTPLNTAVVVAKTRTDTDLEYRLATVEYSVNPKWMLTLPDIELSVYEDLQILLLEVDDDGDDDVIGQCVIRDVTSTNREQREWVSLRPRQAYSSTTVFETSGNIEIKYEVFPRVPVTAVSPNNYSVSLRGVNAVARTEYPLMFMQVLCNDENAKTSLAVDPSAGSLSDTFDFVSTRSLTTFRLSAHSTNRGSHRGQDMFLGEALVEVQCTAGDITRTVDLQPRWDPRYQEDDVRLLNVFGSLGSVSVCISRSRANESRLRRLDGGATVDAWCAVMTVVEVTDVPGRADYYVTCTPPGVSRMFTPVETSAHPRFRYKMTFEQTQSMCAVPVTLWVATGSGRDTPLGEATVTLTVPKHTDAVESDSAWVELKGTTGVFPKVFLKWKTHFKNTTAHMNTTHMSAGEMSPMVPMMRSARPAPNPVAAPQSYNIRVFIPHLGKLHETTVSSASVPVGDVVATLCSTLQLRHGDYGLSYQGAELDARSAIGKSVPNDGVMSLTQYPDAQNVIMQSGPSKTKSIPPVVSSRPTTPKATNIVQSRLQGYVGEAGDGIGPLVTVAVRVTDTVPWSSSVLTRIVEDGDVAGFCRPVAGLRQGENGYHFELYIQASASDVLRLMAKILSAAPSALIEEVKGYIPIMAAPFRVAMTVADGAKMWELCASQYVGEDLGVPQGAPQTWFYRSLDMSDMESVRYIDERA
eukprot:PhM_4_TR15664/c1_g1_i2/m.21248